MTRGQTLSLQPIFFILLPENVLSNPQLLNLPPGKKEKLQKGLYRRLQEPRLTPSQHNRSELLTCCPCLPHPKVVPIGKHLGDIWGDWEEMCFTSFFRKHLHFRFSSGENVKSLGLESEIVLKAKIQQKIKWTWAPSSYSLSCRKDDEFRKQKLRAGDTNNTSLLFSV